MGLIDDIITRISGRRAHRTVKTLTQEDEEKLKEIITMFDRFERQTIVDVLFEHNKNFEETVEELLKRSDLTSEEAPANSENVACNANAEVSGAEEPEEERAEEAEPEELEPAPEYEGLVEEDERDEMPELVGGLEERLDEAPELTEEKPAAREEPAPKYDGLGEEEWDAIVEYMEGLEEDEVPELTEEKPVAREEPVKEEPAPEESKLVEARLEAVTREFEEKKVRMLEKLARKEERRRRKILNERPKMIELDLHLKMVTQLQKEKDQVEQQKRKAMEWCLLQMGEVQRQNQIQKEKIEEQQKEIEKLRLQISQRDAQLAKMENLLTESTTLLEEYSCGIVQNL